MLTFDEIKELIWFSCFSVGATIVGVRFALVMIRAMFE